MFLSKYFITVIGNKTKTISYRSLTFWFSASKRTVNTLQENKTARAIEAAEDRQNALGQGDP